MKKFEDDKKFKLEIQKIVQEKKKYLKELITSQCHNLTNFNI